MAKEKTVLKFSICDKRFKEVNAVEFTLVEALQDLKQREGRKFAAMVLEDFKVDKSYHIGHYLSSGWSLGLGFALDFSKANGTLEDTGYIHSITKPEQNAYLKLMEEFSQAFVDIKNEMTTFQVYGFGARDPDSCFALQGYENDDPNVQSFDDVKELYMEKATELEGSEQFALAPVLR